MWARKTAAIYVAFQIGSALAAALMAAATTIAIEASVAEHMGWTETPFFDTFFMPMF